MSPGPKVTCLMEGFSLPLPISYSDRALMATIPQQNLLAHLLLAIRPIRSGTDPPLGAPPQDFGGRRDLNSPSRTSPSPPCVLFTTLSNLPLIQQPKDHKLFLFSECGEHPFSVCRGSSTLMRVSSPDYCFFPCAHSKSSFCPFFAAARIH